MNDLEVGQVLSLRIRLDYYGVFKEKHPYLIIAIRDDGAVEIGQLHSLEGKEYEAIDDRNKVIFQGHPTESVIDKDSFIQLNNVILVENFDELINYRRQPDKLSDRKLMSVIDAYRNYHKKHHIAEDRTVYLDREEIENLNS